MVSRLLNEKTGTVGHAARVDYMQKFCWKRPQKEFRGIGMCVRDRTTGLLTGKLGWQTGKRIAVVTALV